MADIINSHYLIQKRDLRLIASGIILFLFICFQASGQQLFVRSFPQEVYKGGQNFRIAQDKQGIIYVTNTEGLLTYDGTSWDLIALPDNLFTLSIAIDNSEKIYTGSNGAIGYLTKNSSGQYSYFSLVPALTKKYAPPGNVHETTVFNESVFFFDEEHVYIYNDQKFKVHDIKTAPFRSSFILDENLYIINLDNELYRYTDMGLVKISLNNDIYIHSMSGYHQNKGLAVDDKSRIWIFTPEAPEKNQWTLLPGNYLNELKESKISRIRYIKHNQIALFTSDEIIFINEQGEINTRVGSGFLESYYYEDSFIDSNHNLWVVYPSDILLISTSSPLHYYNKHDGLQGYILSFAKNGGYDYVGTEKGLYFRKGKSRFMLSSTAHSGDIWDFHHNGKQLYAAHSYGIYEVEGEKATKIIGHDYIMSLCGTPQDSSTLIIGTYNTGLWLLKKGPNKWEKTQIKGFEEYARFMQADLEGNIWVSHDMEGIWKLRLNDRMDSVISLKFYNVKNGLPSNVNNRIYQLNNNRLVVTTTNGVYHYNKQTDRFEPEPSINEALGKNTLVYSITETPKGDIYFWGMLTPGEATAGLLKKQTGGHYNLITVPFRKIAESIRKTSIDVDAPLLSLGPDEVWIGNRKRLMAYNPRRETFYNDTIRTYIKQVWAKDSLIHSNWQESARHKLSYDKNSLHFQFTSTFFESAEKLYYQYKLDGFEENWSSWSNSGKAVYTNLPEGDYVFMVRAKNVYNNVGKPVYFKFYIRPPWYRTPWAYLNYVILSILSVYWIIRMKTKRVERQKILLQEEVIEKTRELLIMNEEITSINEDINKKNQEIAKQAEELRKLNFTKDKIFSVISHDLRGSVKQIPELLNLFDSGYITNEEFKSCIPNLKEASKNLSNLTDNLLHWAKCQMKGIDVKRTKFKLVEIIDETLRLLKGQAETKELQLISTVDDDLQVFADKDMMRLLLRNLVGNAIKFTLKNGVVSIKSQMKQGFIHISVTDTGVGLTKKEIDKILSKEFFTKHGTAGEKGSGLGLMLCKEFAELHGGNLHIKGTPDEGSTFTFTIPQ
ncbi:hypothetical protein JMN32_12345 [Fulvivirga sp. 29W222]|uniref:histidine kinase n=1 Tax=Fulvivirga marina TaxID=2494733 RepID=A0A937FY32_9BACT|nr:ATP-binding protein [Fulvivirga marina]MBL6447103.1 hypothetical protein [Fulvivirga marina]